MSHDVETSIEGEHFLHRTLWQVVVRQIEHARKNPIGAFYEHLVAMVFAFHTLEAYLNHCGQKLDPKTWANERKVFRSSGFDGKIRKVLELVGFPEPPRETRPYHSVWVLKDLRDMIAHAKTERIEATYRHSTSDEPPLFHETGLSKIVNASAAETAVQDINEFIVTIHELARTLVTNDVWFAGEALGGPLSYTTTGSTIIRP
jgi:hypothetical protein